MNELNRKGRIVIDPEKCVGCGQCVDACHAGALAMVDGKACLVDENHCDGLGACIGECPFGAISFMDVKAAPAPKPAGEAGLPREEKLPCGCPGHLNQVFSAPRPPVATAAAATAKSCACDRSEGLPPIRAKSKLGAWPIQLHLIRPTSPQFQGADLVIAASCSAFSHAAFHEEMLRGKSLVIACPKLDRQEGYLEKLTELLRDASPASVTVVRMEVPCCQGLTQLVVHAKKDAGSTIPIRELTIGLQGGVVKEAAF